MSLATERKRNLDLHRGLRRSLCGSNHGVWKAISIANLQDANNWQCCVWQYTLYMFYTAVTIVITGLLMRSYKGLEILFLLLKQEANYVSYEASILLAHCGQMGQ